MWNLAPQLYISTTAISMNTKIGMVVTYHKELPPMKSHYLFITCPVRSRDKRKPLYIHYHSAYGHQAWEGGGLP